MYTEIIVFIIIVITVIVSYKGFTNRQFFDRYKFEVEKILVYKDYKRLITSGFLHIDWLHLIFNMFSLYIFSGPVSMGLGMFSFLLIYFGSMIGGELLSLFIHRHHGDYSAAGASGAVYGVMFASVALLPDMDIGLFPLPISIPAWLYALIFTLVSIYGIRSRRMNVGHDAHLGGALIGMVLALILRPSLFLEHYGIILLILAPVIIFLYLIITRPEILFVDNLFYKTHNSEYTIDHRYNMDRADQQQEVDRILEKINRRGMGSLSKKEKATLEEYSKRMR